MPVLLAAHGLDNETTCAGDTMSVLWSAGAGARNPTLCPVALHLPLVPCRCARLAQRAQVRPGCVREARRGGVAAECHDHA